MKILLALFMFTSTFAIATVESPVGVLLNLAPQNCFSEDLYLDAIFSGAECSLCTECKESVINSPLATQSAQNLRRVQLQNANDLMFQQLQKILASNLHTLTTLRSLKPTGSQYSSMVSSCKLDQLSTDISSCLPEDGSQSNILNRLRDLEGQVQGEILNQILPDFTGKGLVPRATQDQGCGYSEAQSSAIIIEAFEESLDQTIVNKILNCPIGNNNHYSECFDEKEKAELQFLVNIESHPLLQSFSTLSDLKSFLAPLANANQSNYREQLNALIYNSRMGNLLDENLAKKCTNAFAVFKKTICEINQPNVNVSLNLELLKTAEHSEFWNSSDQDSSALSLEVISYCPSTDSGAYDINSSFQALIKSIPQNEAEAPYDFYSKLFENQYINHPRKLVCSTNPNSCNTSSPDYTIIRCAISKIKSEPAAIERIQLAKDSSMNRVLEGFIGSSPVNSETKNFLISEGILPQEDGSYVAPSPASQSPQVASSTSSTNNSPSSSGRSPSTNSQTSASAQFAESQASQNPRRQQQASSGLPYNPITSPAFSSAFENQLDDLSDLTNQERQRFSEFQREISRRLSQATSGAPSRQQVQQAAQSVVRERGSSFSPLRQQQFVNSYVNSFDEAQNSFQSAPGFANSQGANLGNDLAGPSQEYLNRQRALENMASGRSVSASGGVAAASAASGASGRAPASASDVLQGTNSDSVLVNLNAFEANPQAALTSKLPNVLSDNFFIEIQGAGEVYKYQVSKSSQGFSISLLQGSQKGQNYIRTLQTVLTNHSRRTGVTRSALLETVTGAN